MTGLANKVALITGAGSGIGRHTAISYALEGCKVVVSDVDEVGGEATVNEIKATKAAAVFIKADVSDPAQCEKLVQETLNAFGKLDIACNNAGIGGEANPIADMSLEGWRKVIAVNLDSVFYCMKYQIKAMLEIGHGSIVNIASILGQVGFPNSAGYVAAKHGVVGLTKNAALEYSNRGIRINAVGPGFINTPLLNSMDESNKDMLVSLHPIGRLGEAPEVANLIVWLSSSNASFVTGAYYAVDGGYLAR